MNSLIVPKSLSESVYQLVSRYLCLRLGRECVPCPYWINKLRRGLGKPDIRGPWGGKGKPEEIEQATRQAAEEKGVDLNKLSAEEMRSFMKRAKIGVDCSGFAYQVLEAFELSKGGKGLNGRLVTTPPRNPDKEDRFRINADYLTKEINSVSITLIDKIKPGDMIRMDGGNHVIVVLEVTENEIVYVHSSQMTRITGVHLGTIRVVDRHKGLGDQGWLELTKSGENWGKLYFDPARGDGMFRLKI